MSTQTGHELIIEVKTHGFELPPVEYGRIETALRSLREVVDCFPVKSIKVTATFHARREDYHVKMSLNLPGRTLFTGERDRVVYTAIERCIDKMLGKVSAYKLHMQREDETSKQARGTHHVLKASTDVDTGELEEARVQGDYLRFRRELDGFSTGLSENVGRWVKRYPEIEAMLGDGITISDIVEDVFFHAFEQFEDRNSNVPPGVWLEGLVDQSIQDVLRSPETEFANISYAKHRLS